MAQWTGILSDYTTTISGMTNNGDTIELERTASGELDIETDDGMPPDLEGITHLPYYEWEGENNIVSVDVVKWQIDDEDDGGDILSYDTAASLQELLGLSVTAVDEPSEYSFYEPLYSEEDLEDMEIDDEDELEQLRDEETFDEVGYETAREEFENENNLGTIIRNVDDSRAISALMRVAEINDVGVVNIGSLEILDDSGHAVGTINDSEPRVQSGIGYDDYEGGEIDGRIVREGRRPEIGRQTANRVNPPRLEESTKSLKRILHLAGLTRDQ